MALKDDLLKDAKSIADDLKEKTDVLAVILSGPLAMDRVSEKDRLYFFVITNRDDGIIEHHFLEKYGNVKRKMEIGFFPKNVVEYMLKEGYKDMPSYKALESLRCGVVMYEKNKVGSDAVERSKKFMPEKRFIGEYVHLTKATIDDARSLIENSEYKNAVLVARAAVDWAAHLLLAVKYKTIHDNGESIYNAIEKYCSPKEISIYKETHAIENITKEDAEKIMKTSVKYVKNVLSQINVSPDFIEL